MKNKDFVTRVISSVILVAILLLAGLVGGFAILIFCVAVAFVGMKELYMAVGLYDKNAKDKKDNMLAIAGMVMCIVYFIASGTFAPLISARFFAMKNAFPDSLSGYIEITDMIGLVNTLSYLSASALYVFAVITVMALIYVFTFKRFDFKQVSYAIVGALYTPLFVTSIFLIRCLNGGKYLFWLIFISSWICDTCAYLVGCNFGKHKMAPVLSPKKSVEGAIGGVVGSVIVAFIFAYFVQHKLFSGNNYATEYMIICLVGACFSQVGDLFASAIKRNNDIKDYGNLIPGHGGILDRFDSVIFVAPIVYVLSLIIL